MQKAKAFKVYDFCAIFLLTVAIRKAYNRSISDFKTVSLLRIPFSLKKYLRWQSSKKTSSLTQST
jgi:hypothetical protein